MNSSSYTENSLYLFYGKIIRAQHQRREKMIDKPPRLKKGTIYLSGEHRAQRKSHPKIFNFAQWSDVKSCAVRMFNVMLGMTLKVKGIRNIHNGHQTNHTPLI